VPHPIRMVVLVLVLLILVEHLSGHPPQRQVLFLCATA
jgi:hypothetical protein